MKEDYTHQQSEKPLVSYENSLELAQSLEDKYHDQIILAERPTFGRSNIMDVLNNIPDEVTSRFYGHGITRGVSSAHKLAALINILENSTIKGDQGHISGSKHIGAYTNVDFLILSHVDMDLMGDGKKVENQIGWVADIGAYVVGSRYYPIIDELKTMYPDKNIIKADEVSVYMDNEIKIA